MSFEVD